VRAWIAGGVIAVLAAACHMAACRPLTIVVAQKEERARLERVPHGVATTDTGRLEEGRRTEIVRDYWVRAADGAWYPVSGDRYRAAEVGRSLEICR
jgi:hypothetical protein